MNMNCLPIERESECSTIAAWAPMGLAVCAVVMLNLILIIAGVRHTPRYEETLLRAKWSIAENEANSFTWIVTGDSSGTFGVDPGILSEVIIGESANLCTFGSMGLVGDLWMVDEYLKHHAPPQAVVVVHAADVWTGDRGEALYQYAAAIPESTSSLMLRLVRADSTPSEIFHFLKYRDYVPVLLIKDRLRNQLGWSNDAEGTSESNLILPDNGLIRMGEDSASVENVRAYAREYWQSFNEGIGRRKRAALQKLVQRADSYGFHLYLANGPVAEDVKNSSEFAMRTKTASDELQRIADEYDHVDYILVDWVSFPSAKMENPNHVVGTAVDEYTRELGCAIRSIQE